MMKKLTAIIIAIFLLIGLGATTVNAASCTVSVGGSATIDVDKTVTVTVNFSQPVGSVARLYLSFDSSILEYVGSNAWNASASGNQVQLKYIDDSGAKPYKTISSMTVTFKGKKAGSSTVQVTTAKAGDKDAMPYTVSIGSGATITVKATASNEGNTQNNQNNQNSQGNKNNQTTNTNTNTNSNTNKTPKFTSVNQTVYVTTEQLNIRQSWTTSSAVLGTLKKGDSIKRTGIGDNGWSKVSYNGKTAYVSSSYITTTKPSTNNKGDDKNNTTNNEIANEATNNTVTNEVTNNEISNNEATNNTVGNEVNNVENGVGENNAVGNNEIAPKEEKGDFNYILWGIIIIIILAILIIIIASIREHRRTQKNRRK